MMKTMKTQNGATFGIGEWIKAGVGLTLGNLLVWFLMSIWFLGFGSIGIALIKGTHNSKVANIIGLVFICLGLLPFLPFMIQFAISLFGAEMIRDVFNT